MEHDYLELLMHIAKKRGLFDDLKSSTSEIANALKVSQQTISRKLREMEAKGLIKRVVLADGLRVRIDDKGRDYLKGIFFDLRNIFAKKNELFGYVSSGIGEGRYYVGMANYQKQFEKELGFKAYPGTLNLKVKKSDAMNFLNNLKPITIYGFRTKTRTFGPLTCYKIMVNSIGGAIVIPERARHSEDIIEIIAPVYLRGRLKLKDKDKVKLVVQ